MAPDARRDQILSVACDAFSRKGFGGVKIAELAIAAGIAQGLLYRYFPSKSALFAALIEDSFTRMESAIARVQTLKLSGGEKLALGIAGLLDRLKSDAAFAQRMVLVANASVPDNVPPELRDTLSGLRTRPYLAVEAIFAEGQVDGSIGPGSRAQLSLLFWAVFKGLALHRLTFSGDDLPDAAMVTAALIPTRTAA